MSLHYTLYPMKVNPELNWAREEINQNSRSEETGRESITQWFGDQLRDILKKISGAKLKEIEEIRIRIGKPLLLLGGRHELFVDIQGKSVPPEKAYRVEREDLLQTLERMTQSSLYAAEEEMKQGYLTLPGGHRVGITGEAILKKGEIQTLKHISGLNVRIAQEIPGKAALLLPKLFKPDGTFCHTIILSPPKAGKTTLLRDLIRNLSDGNPAYNVRGQTVGVVDERGELAGMWRGVPAYNLGCRADVLDGCPKWIGISMLVRSMSPSVVAVDELGHPQDVEAVLDAVRTGVSVLSSAHASSLEEAFQRPSLKALFDFGVFERVIVLSRRQGPGTVEAIYDLKKQPGIPLAL